MADEDDRVSDFIANVRRRFRRQEEIAHEEKLAAIRARSHALIWTGSESELVDTISRWYGSGWLVAGSLQDALQKAAIHFVGTDGKPIMNTASTHSAQPQSGPKIEEKISRKAFVTPLLDAKGWSILDWASEAEVAPATAVDYLQDKTKPYRSTRLKLAKALGVSVEQLPR
ncbi:MAG: helix-turn-helix transcriptional regulator [Candidatus Korobacteraceae bacterium]